MPMEQASEPSSALQSVFLRESRRVRVAVPPKVGLHDGQRGFNAFGDYQPLIRLNAAKTNRAASTGREHHLRRIDRSLTLTVEGKEGPVYGDRYSVSTVGHQRDHRWPNGTRWMPQSFMESERCRWRKKQTA